jgi:hypothetical protein
MKRSLTKMMELTTMTLVGQTEASNAEEQLARDSRLNATNCRRGGSHKLPSHFTICKDNSEPCNALKKPNKKSPAEGGFLITEKRKSPKT